MKIEIFEWLIYLFFFLTKEKLCNWCEETMHIEIKK